MLTSPDLWRGRYGPAEQKCNNGQIYRGNKDSRTLLYTQLFLLRHAKAIDHRNIFQTSLESIPAKVKSYGNTKTDNRTTNENERRT